MLRTVLRKNGHNELIEVGDDYENWNKIIGADIGEIVPCRSSNLILWVDEEGLLKKNPVLNLAAVLLTGKQVVGDVIVFNRGDIK